MTGRLRSAALLLGCFVFPAAQAQVSASVSLVSDYRFRGISLSEEKPAAQTTLAYDGDGGWYAGAFASTVEFYEDSRPGAQLIGYAGRAGSWSHASSWDAGIATSTFSRQHDYDYPEIYGGVTVDSLTFRLHYARSYFGQSTDAVYIETNGAWPLRERMQLVVHLGGLRNARVPDADRCCGFDARLGVDFAAWGTHVEVTAAARSPRNPVYPAPAGQGRETLIVGLTRAF
jgi:uncharacterized protein (TIGR02001 family)